jgi:hypothetical protein
MKKNPTSFNLSNVVRALVSCLGFPNKRLNMADCFRLKTLSVCFSSRSSTSQTQNLTLEYQIKPKIQESRQIDLLKSI